MSEASGADPLVLFGPGHSLALKPEKFLVHTLLYSIKHAV